MFIDGKTDQQAEQGSKMAQNLVETSLSCNNSKDESCADDISSNVGKLSL